MIKFPKAATFAAISVTLIAAGISADAGFAFGSNQNDMALKADTIQIDEATLAADQENATLAKSTTASMTISKSGDVIFAPGTGEQKTESLELDAPDLDAVPDKKTDTAKISASSLAELVRKQETGGALDREAYCLAGAVYFESKGESLAGQLAVARVVMARAKSGRFPGSLCGVVFQKSQFSFVRGNAMPNINKDSQNWRNAIAISKIALDGAWKSPVEGALFFHARRVSPGWRLTRLGTIDNHIFYR
jgi:spore germination cell wall hydrolase CwlJ-like protein